MPHAASPAFGQTMCSKATRRTPCLHWPRPDTGSPSSRARCGLTPINCRSCESRTAAGRCGSRSPCSPTSVARFLLMQRLSARCSRITCVKFSPLHAPPRQLRTQLRDRLQMALVIAGAAQHEVARAYLHISASGARAHAEVFASLRLVRAGRNGLTKLSEPQRDVRLGSRADLGT